MGAEGAIEGLRVINFPHTNMSMQAYTKRAFSPIYLKMLGFTACTQTWDKYNVYPSVCKFAII